MRAVRNRIFERVTDTVAQLSLFEGVDSCFYVWINGIFVGYSQVSHSTSEFHITRYLKEGENRLTVLVLNGVTEVIWRIRINYV